MATTSSSKGGGRGGLVTVGIVAVAAWAAGFYFRAAPVGSPLVPEVAPSTPTVTAREAEPQSARPATAAPRETATTLPSAEPSATTVATAASGAAPVPSSSATASATASASADSSTLASADRDDLRGCVAALFPDDAFAKHEPSFEFLCVEPYPRRGVTRLQAQVAKGKWGSGRTT
ncbi:MAG: hypothetical protein JRI23_02435, partial [Deltaproteobacteria bacterium]|nr:hypothetical protein [Deltaproteobacteria bacterium]MBW2530344.1 hypothetical protein [Deltaproteobacteria bacterium]